MTRISAKFEAEILMGHKGAAVLVPFDPEEVWGIAPRKVADQPGGQKGFRIRGTFAGARFEGWIGSRWGRRFILADEKLIRKAKVKVGDTVELVIEPVAG
ncbi:MAG: DUF1905 domain-containing protein [Planctomycetes bacterium]|nr:DUF1905 domain-containing protein [Planctomycetota bacterium]